MKEVPFSAFDSELPLTSHERDGSIHHLGNQAAHEVIQRPSEIPEINQDYSDAEFPMLSHFTIDGQDYMVTGTWFSVDDNYNYSTDMLAIQHMKADGETLNLTPAELRHRINSHEKNTPLHFEIAQTKTGTVLNILKTDEKYLSVEIADEYTDAELSSFIDATKRAITAIDNFVEGNSDQLLNGLRVKIGEELTTGGGEAISSGNLILMNGRKTLISLTALREVTNSYEDTELRGGLIDQHDPTGAFVYNLVHEVGHIIDERTKSGVPMHRVPAAESPTKYGRAADIYNSEKDHEAFAEGFAHMVFDMPVSNKLAKAVRETIEAKLVE